MPTPAPDSRVSGQSAAPLRNPSQSGQAQGSESPTATVRVRSADEPTRILVLNPKGGCGKTTIATNLACWYAFSGRQVSLMDHDAQASSTHWLAQRTQGLPTIHSIPAFRQESPGMTRAFQFRLPFDTSRVIIDTPAGAPNSEVRKLLRLADVVVVPVLPSAIDIRALADFLVKLEREREHRPIALVANRLRVNTLGSSKLNEFLAGLRIPVVAQLHDLQVYAHCAENGRGLHDMDGRDIARERDALRQLADWIDAVGHFAVTRPAPPENLTLALPDAI